MTLKIGDVFSTPDGAYWEVVGKLEDFQSAKGDEYIIIPVDVEDTDGET